MQLQPAKQKESGVGGGGGKKKGSRKAAPTAPSSASLPNGEVEQGAGGADGAPSVEVSPPSAVAQSDSLEWIRETPRSLWTKIAGEARSYFYCQKVTEYVYVPRVLTIHYLTLVYLLCGLLNWHL